MKNKITSKDTGKYRVTTSHGTYYVLDLDNGLGMRVPAEGRGELAADNKWFRIQRILACTVGEPMDLYCLGIAGDDWYTWRRSTEIVAIEEIE